MTVSPTARRGGLCCLKTCGTCGGGGCGRRKGGEAGCCDAGIKRQCGPTVAPPCLVGPSPPPAPRPSLRPGAGGETCRDEPFVALRDGVSGRFFGLPLESLRFPMSRDFVHETGQNLLLQNLLLGNCGSLGRLRSAPLQEFAAPRPIAHRGLPKRRRLHPRLPGEH